MSDEIPADFMRDFEALCNDKQTLEVQMTRYQAWCLMAVIQLASRHSEAMKSSPLRIAVEIANDLQRRLSTTAALARVANQGWDQTFDRPRGSS